MTCPSSRPTRGAPRRSARSRRDPRVRYVLGGHPDFVVDGVDAVIVSPGVPLGISRAASGRRRRHPGHLGDRARREAAARAGHRDHGDEREVDDDVARRRAPARRGPRRGRVRQPRHPLGRIRDGRSRGGARVRAGVGRRALVVPARGRARVRARRRRAPEPHARPPRPPRLARRLRRGQGADLRAPAARSDRGAQRGRRARAGARRSRRGGSSSRAPALPARGAWIRDGAFFSNLGGSPVRFAVRSDLAARGRPQRGERARGARGHDSVRRHAGGGDRARFASSSLSPTAWSTCARCAASRGTTTRRERTSTPRSRASKACPTAGCS